MARSIAAYLRPIMARSALRPAAPADGAGPSPAVSLPNTAAGVAPFNARAAASKASTRLSEAALLGLLALGAFVPQSTGKSATVEAIAPDVPARASPANRDTPSITQSITLPIIPIVPLAPEPRGAVENVRPSNAHAVASMPGEASPFAQTTPQPETAPPVTRVVAAIVPPVRREAPRVVQLHVEPDPNVTAALAKTRPLKGKFKTVRARAVAPGKALKPAEPSRQIIVASLHSPDVISDVVPEFLGVLPAAGKVVKGKVVSERKAKPIARPAQAMAAVARDDRDDELVHRNARGVHQNATPATGAPVSETPATVSPATVSNVWAPEQIAEARDVCRAALQGLDIVAQDAPPLKEGACGAPAPIVVSKLGKPQVSVQPAAMLTCPMAVALNTWLTKSVQPAARTVYGVPVVRLISASSYACRNRYGAAGAPLSEHALVNALDLSGFELADGRTVKVLGGWGPVARDAKPVQVSDAAATKPASAGMMRVGAAGSASQNAPDTGVTETKDRTFLQRIHTEACETFGTVLGPEANDAHRNHFHLDMMARRRSAFCQ